MAFVRLASAGLLSAVLAGVLLAPSVAAQAPACRAREGRRARGAAVFGDARRLDGEGRWRAGRRGVGARAGHPDRVRVDARRQRPAARPHRLSRDVRREEPLPGVSRLRPAAVRDPRAPDGPRRDRHVRPGRPRHDHDRHVQRRAARLPVPGERAGRAGRRRQQRDGRRGGLVLGRDLELGRPRDRRGLHRRDRDPVPRDAVPGRCRARDLRHHRRAVVPAERAPPDLDEPARPRAELLHVPVQQGQRVPGHGVGPQRGDRPDGDRQPDRRARRESRTGRWRTGRRRARWG